MKRYWLLAAGAAALSAVGAGLMLATVNYSVPAAADVGIAGEEGQPMPAFELRTFEGATIKSDAFAGKPLVIHSWASWSPFCVRELQDLAAVRQEFGEQVAVVAINRAEPVEVARQFTEEVGVAGDLTWLLDETDSYYQSIGGLSIPETLFISADGMIQLHQRGPMDRARTRQQVQRLLE